MTKFVIVLVTAGSEEEAGKIADALLDKKIAACVNIIPSVKSVFWWEGKKETEEEFLLLIKSRTEIVDEVVEAVKANHSYDVPEIISIPVSNGSKAYLKWLGREIE